MMRAFAFVLLASLLLTPAVTADPLDKLPEPVDQVVDCIRDGDASVGCFLGVEPDPVWCVINYVRYGHPCR